MSTDFATALPAAAAALEARVATLEQNEDTADLEIPYETAAMLLAGDEPPGQAEDDEMPYGEALSILIGNEVSGEAEDGEIPYWLANQILHGGTE